MSWQIDAIRKRIYKKRKDFVCIFVGPRGSGKSAGAITLCSKLDKTFDVSRIVFSIEDFMKLAGSNLPRGSCILFDEVGIDWSSRSWYSASNKIINNAVLLLRPKGYIIVMTTPMFNFLDSIGRSNVVVLFEAIDADRKNRRIQTKMFRIQISREGKIFNKYMYDDEGEREEKTYFSFPPNDLWKAYMKKREEYLNRNISDGLEQLKFIQQQETDKRTGHDIAPIVQQVMQKIDYYTRDYKGHKSIDTGLLMNDFGIGLPKARKVASVVRVKSHLE